MRKDRFRALQATDAKASAARQSNDMAKATTMMQCGLNLKWLRNVMAGGRIYIIINAKAPSMESPIPWFPRKSEETMTEMMIICTALSQKDGAKKANREAKRGQDGAKMEPR